MFNCSVQLQKCYDITELYMESGTKSCVTCSCISLVLVLNVIGVCCLIVEVAVPCKILFCTNKCLIAILE